MIVKPSRTIKYVAAGVIALVIELSLFHVLKYILDLPAWLSHSVSYLITIAVSFTLTRYWVFASRKRNPAKEQMIRYGLLIMGNLLVTNIIISFLIYAKSEPFLAKIIVVGIAAIWNYFLYEKIVFRKRKIKSR